MITIPNEVASLCLPTCDAVLINKNIRKLAYVKYIKDLLATERLDNYYSEYVLSGNYSHTIFYSISVSYGNYVTRDLTKYTLFGHTKTSTVINVGKIVSQNPPNTIYHVEEQPSNGIKDEISKGGNLRIDILSMYNALLLHPKYQNLKEENESLYKIAVKEWLVEKMLNNTQCLNIKDAISIVEYYVWMKHNCISCDISYSNGLCDISYCRDDLNFLKESLIDCNKIKLVHKCATEMTNIIASYILNYNAK